ncbi:TIGR02391 family protein [Erythrobacter crassostreae]|uniref:TIGR02391 family protein n=1 Tax=Erythrobacter crassostreae TaxID=2828328 RepID=A0A9X1F5M3_9SPHN|nr:TIGR02391 family protein [Erythrobacter crassostrea]MBV7259743.1 TIGR02391 family protein [Erythrobacter crassostrea]
MPDQEILRKASARARALKNTMDMVLNSKTADHARWMAFPAFYKQYNPIAETYVAETGDQNVQRYNINKIPSAGSVIWPVAKAHFDQLYTDVQTIVELLSDYQRPARLTIGFNELLHPEIIDVASAHYESGNFRNAVLDSIVAIMDRLRAITGLDLDGDNLINQAFSPAKPRVILSDIETESGRSDQRGFMEIYKGAYRGIRNPKAHSLVHDLDEMKVGQYLVFLSLLMRRLDEATLNDVTD